MITAEMCNYFESTLNTWVYLHPSILQYLYCKLDKSAIKQYSYYSDFLIKNESRAKASPQTKYIVCETVFAQQCVSPEWCHQSFVCRRGIKFTCFTFVL